MSAIDFSMDIVRQPDPKGDRVNVVLLGRFLPCVTDRRNGATDVRRNGATNR